MPPNANTTQAPPTRTLVTAVVVLVVLFILAIFLYAMERRDNAGTGNGNTNGTASEDVNEGEVALQTGVPGEPTIITSRSGTITGIAGNAITFESVIFGGADEGYVTARLTAETTSATRFTELDRTQPLSPSASGTTTSLPLTDITAQDLRVGNAIDVFASTNLKDRTRFDVTEVRRTLLP